jgi:4-aminobutyrate aminotransferase-like enzyme
VTSAAERVLRLTPPLTIEPADVAEALDILQEVLA